MDPFSLLNKEFNIIVDMIWDIYNNKETETMGISSHIEVLRTELLRFHSRYPSTFSIEKDDIRQQLSYLWLKCSQEYTKQERKEKDYLLKDYLLACTIWGMKSWYYQEVVGMSHGTEIINPGHLHDELWYELDLSFLTRHLPYPFDSLTFYDRYLIYLYLKEDKNIIEIANILQKDRDVVSRQMKKLHSKLRRLGNYAPENSR